MYRNSILISGIRADTHQPGGRDYVDCTNPLPFPRLKSDPAPQKSTSDSGMAFQRKDPSLLSNIKKSRRQTCPTVMRRISRGKGSKDQQQSSKRPNDSTNKWQLEDEICEGLRGRRNCLLERLDGERKERRRRKERRTRIFAKW